MTRNILQGYVVNAEFGRFRVPAPMQNVYLREYATRNNLIFKLSVGEYSFPGCYLQLESIYSELPNLEGIGMCSMFMLPKPEKKRFELYKACIDSGAAIHMLIEGIVLRKEADIERVEQALIFDQLLKFSPTHIDPALIPPSTVNDSFTDGKIIS